MATTAAVSAAASQVANLLTQEATYLWGVEDHIKELQSELLWMRCFLEEADKRQADDKLVRVWVSEIRDIAYDVEDVIETFALKIAPRRKEGCANALRRSTCILKEASLLHKIKSQIEKIIERIQKSTRRLQTYGIKQLGDEGSSSSSRERRREQRRSYPHLVQENVVGLDDGIKELVSLLVDRGQELRAVSIFGMGGIGKTTLAKKVYNHHRVQDHFQHCAWVYVSQQCEEKDVWADILSSLDPLNPILRDMDFRLRDPQKLSKGLHDFLKNKRYLVVLDDLWSAQDWDLLKPGFPMEGPEGKVLVTSRSRDVGLHIDPKVHLYQVQCLNDDNSWELFQKIALLKRDPTECVINKELQELGNKMVKCCKGLPLAISALGGILATKDCTSHEWEKVHKNVGSYFKEEKVDTVHGSLSLSYEDLPLYLKPCFLYLAHFPEDYDIPVQRLLQMWIAEGLISTTMDDEDEVVEDIAENYLIELLDRCIIQVGERHTNLQVSTCRIHDLMRDFCLSKAKQEGFLYVADHSHDSQDDENILQKFASLKYSARRLTIHKSGVIHHIKNPRLRTLLLFNPFVSDDFKEFPEDSLLKRAYYFFDAYEKKNDFLACAAAIVTICLIKGMTRQFISHILNSFGKLRVLHIQGENLFCCNELKDIDSLIHLRYLCLTGADISKLPSRLGKLSYLLTLDLRDNFERPRIPDVICRIRQLRHLYFPKDFCCKTKLRLGNLRNLRTLVNFSTIYCHVRDISFLTNLRELSMRGFCDYEDDFNRCCAKCCCDSIQFILDKSNHYIGLEEDPMPMLEKLPNLRILVVEADAFIVKEMICSARGFAKLESLTLDGLSKLVEFKISEGAMTNLYHLKIRNCPEMKMLPSGFKSIVALKKVDIEEMPRDFENWWKN